MSRELEPIPCPKCGCPVSELACRENGMKYHRELPDGRIYQRRLCDNPNCRHHRRSFRHTVVPDDQEKKVDESKNNSDSGGMPVVVYQPTYCPRCKSKNTRINRTTTDFRYHRCRACGKTFKSTEAPPP